MLAVRLGPPTATMPGVSPAVSKWPLVIMIAVGVGGIFGNLNWKWFGAIIISLVVIASAGEIISLMTNKVEGGNGYNTVKISTTAAGITSTIK